MAACINREVTKAAMFDPKCLELAAHFLIASSDERTKVALAEHIQEAIEIYLCGLSSGAQTTMLDKVVHCSSNLLVAPVGYATSNLARNSAIPEA
jgi:hypothetical protein